jgi:hypothetical protein
MAVVEDRLTHALKILTDVLALQHVVRPRTKPGTTESVPIIRR